ncbi:MAG TPA: hypothetical protein GX403_04455 [Rhodocyclaceae bacterium]|nr:hypothetical protein [Rhodocyclaceae bacterium]
MSSRKFLSLFLLCALVPLAAAWASLRLGWFSAAPTVNHGEWLTQELRLLPPPAQGGGQWHLVYVPAGEGELGCSEASAVPAGPGADPAPTAQASRCEQALLILQQLHAGLGRKQARVQALVLAAENPAARARYPHVEWQAVPVGEPALQGRIVLVDPRGLALLRYAVEPDPQQAQRVAGDIRSDLLRLMNYDRSGV